MSTDAYSGLVDTSVLHAQDVHRSSSNDRNIISFYQHLHKWDRWKITHSEILDRLRRTGFYHVMNCAADQLCHPLLTTLVERWWRPETNTFYMRYGEITITLLDIFILTGLPVNSLSVIAQHPSLETFVQLMGLEPPEWSEGSPTLALKGCETTTWYYRKTRHPRYLISIS